MSYECKKGNGRTYISSSKKDPKSSFKKFISELCEFYEEPMARLPDTKTHRFRFEIPSSNGKKLYIVSQQISNLEWQCSCTGWIAHHKPCKHLKSTEAERMKLEKSVFGAKNKDFNGPAGNPDTWKNLLNEGIPEPEIEVAQTATRKLKIKETDH